MGGSKQTQTTNRQPWEPAQAGLKGVLEKANTLGNNMSIWTPQYSQDTQAGINQLANLGASPSFGGGTIRNVVGQTSGGMGTGYDTLMSTARGDSLTSSPYLDQVLGKSMQDAADKVNAQFSASGRYGSGAHSGVLSRELGGIEANARLGQYQQERQNQLNAAQLLGNLGLQGAGLSTQADQADANQAGLQLQAGQLRDAMGDATRMAPVNAAEWQAGLINPIAQQGGTETTGEVRITSDVTKPMAGKHLLVVEDIVDTGKTLSVLVAELLAQKPASLAVVVLLRKPSKLAVPESDLGEKMYVGFDIGPEFVVGHCFDYDGRFRDVPDIYALSPAA